MEWRKRGPEWLELQAQLQEPARALVVDDEEVMRELFTAMLGAYKVEAVGDAEAALKKLHEASFDVLITDKNLPGHDGVDLIAQVRAEHLDVPSILVTGYASLETISRALAHGAADYIAKPFDDVRLVRRRVELVVEQHRTDKMLNRIASDLKDAIGRGGAEAEALQPVERSLASFRMALAARPDVLILDAHPNSARLTEMFLKGCGLLVVVAPDVAGLRAAIAEMPPMAVLISLEVPGAAELIPELRAADADLEILAAGRPSDLDEALAAVAAGASDYVFGAIEGIDLLVARVRRAVGRARRRRLFGHLIGLLIRDAGGGAPDVRALLEGLRPRAEAEIEIDEVEIVEEEVDEIEIIDLFEPLLEEDWGTAVGPMDTAQVAAGLDVPYTSVMEQVSWGLEGVDPTRKVELPLKDVLYVSAALKEMIRFLHDPANYPSVASLTTFLGSADDGALAVLMRAWYESLRPKLPEDVRKDLEHGRFDHPRPPYYLKPSDG